MRTRTSGWLAMLVLSCIARSVTAGPDVRVVALDPADGGTLQTGEALYLRLAYQSEQPVRFRVRAYLGGSDPGRAHFNTMPLYPAGSGEALAWLEFVESALVAVTVMGSGWC